MVRKNRLTQNNVTHKNYYTNLDDLPKYPVSRPHEGCEPILVLHVDILSLSYQVRDDRRMTELCRKMYTAAPCKKHNVHQYSQSVSHL